MIVQHSDRRSIYVDPQALRRRRVADRVSLSASVADLVAFLAHGEPRGEFVALAGMTAARVGGECRR